MMMNTTTQIAPQLLHQVAPLGLDQPFYKTVTVMVQYTRTYETPEGIECDSYVVETPCLAPSVPDGWNLTQVWLPQHTDEDAPF